jgi:hypothetical protein
MARNITVFDELCAIAEDNKSSGYLRAYERDLYEHDRNTLATNPYGATRWVWILRGCGTALFPVGVGHDHNWATYWLEAGNERDTPSLAFIVDESMVHRVRPIDYARAGRLAREPHPQGIKLHVTLFGADASPPPY